MILFVAILLWNASYATNIVMDLENAATSNTVENATNMDQSENVSEISDNTVTDTNLPYSTTIDYEDNSGLSISNMINIILIVVGVVIILLGIAIIIRLK